MLILKITLQIIPFLFQAIGCGTLLLLFGPNILVIPFVIFMYPETAGRSLEQMDTYFERGDTWNVFKASKDIDDWRWTKKMKVEDYKEVEAGRKMSTSAKLAEEEMKALRKRDARKSWTKRPLYTLKRKGSNAGIM